jgi:bifunctional non-homologous end joining protein LigD
MFSDCKRRRCFLADGARIEPAKLCLSRCRERQPSRTGAVVLDVDGVAEFNVLHSRKHDHEVQLYAFDILALNGEDLRRLVSMRKTNLAPVRVAPGRHLCRAVREGEIGPELFRAACNMGLESMVSKRVDRPYRAGRSKDWVKVKNRQHPAMNREL